MDIKKRNKTFNEWQKANKDRINMAFPRGFKDRLQAAADEAGESMTQYVVNAVDLRINGATIPTASIPAYNKDTQPPTISTKDKPQPPEDIAKQGGNVLIMWLLNAGYSDEEIRAIVGGS